MATTEPMICDLHNRSIRWPGPLWIGMTAVVVIVAGTGLRIGSPIYHQHAAIQRIEEIGGVVHFAEPAPATKWLVRSVGRLLNFAGAGLTYEHANAFFEQVVEIEEVGFFCDEDTFCKRSPGFICGPLPWVDGPTVNDSNLRCVVGLPNLKRLDLRWTNVSDTGMRYVFQLSALEELDVNGTDVSDASLGNLKRLSHLRKLSLRNTRVTDTGLASLSELAGLQYLDVNSTKVTDAGVAELQRALPGLTIDR